MDNIKKFIEENVNLINLNQFDELYKKLSPLDRTHLSDIFIKAGIDFLSFMKNIPNECFYRSTEVATLIIPKNIKRIGNRAFVDSSLKSVLIPTSVKSIGDSAFSGCYRLASIKIPDSVTSIGYGVFETCSHLTSVTISDSVTSIGDEAFLGCYSLTSITIPDSVTSIGNWVFENCSSLTSITIPDSVTSIGDGVFSGCKKLRRILFNGTRNQWNTIVKQDSWNQDTGDYKIYCTDGEI